MTEFAIRYESYRANPIVLECRINSKLRLYYANKPLEQSSNMIAIELPPDGGAAELELSIDGGTLEASGDLDWRASSTGTGAVTTTLSAPTSDFLTVALSASQGDEVDTGKLYVKVKPHGGLPAGG